MKALTDRLELVRLYLCGLIGDDEKMKQIAFDELLAAMAIADALPEITIALAPDALVSRRAPPPERIIALPAETASTRTR